MYFICALIVLSNNSTKILNKKNAFQRHDKQLSKPKKNVKIKINKLKIF